MKLIGRRLGPDIKILSGPISVILIVILLSVIVFQNGYSRVKVKTAEYQEAKINEARLSKKLTLLREVRSDTLDQTDASLVALPTQNPATLTISSLRAFSTENLIALKEILISGQSEDGGVRKMELKLATEGQEFSDLLAFLKEIINSAPIQTIEKLEVDKHSVGENLFSQEMELSIYWADLPKTLPELTVAIEGLTGDQEAILAKMQSLKSKESATLAPSAPRERSNPFN